MLKWINAIRANTSSNTIKLFLFFIVLPANAFADESVAKVVYHADFAGPKRFNIHATKYFQYDDNV